jgi:hypothetical protein
MLIRAIRPFVAFDDETTTTEPAATTPPVHAPAPTPAPEPAAGPWAADLAVYFEDEAARATADRYLREKIQPRMTKFEQEQSEYAPAREFFDDLRSDPAATALALIAEIYGEDVADKMEEMVAAGVDPAVAAEAATEGTPPAPIADPELEEIKAERRAEKVKATYDAEQTRVLAKPEAQALPLPFDKAQFAVFVSQEEGNFDRALTAYATFQASVVQAAGIQAPAPQADPTAPTTLGSQPGGAPAAVPAVNRKMTMEEALDETLAEMRSQGVTPVGTV